MEEGQKRVDTGRTQYKDECKKKNKNEKAEAKRRREKESENTEDEKREHGELHFDGSESNVRIQRKYKRIER